MDRHDRVVGCTSVSKIMPDGRSMATGNSAGGAMRRSLAASMSAKPLASWRLDAHEHLPGAVDDAEQTAA